MRPLNLVVLISGRGTNLRAIGESIESGRLNATIQMVISNREHAAGLEYARNLHIPCTVLPADWEPALERLLRQLNPDLIVLAGFMKILPADFVKRQYPRMINIHPSLLPAYPGLNTHQRALEAGERFHGATVHFVTPEVDQGPIIAQARVAVRGDDTADSLAARVLIQEHILYPTVLQWFADGRIHWENGTPCLDSAPLPRILSNHL